MTDLRAELADLTGVIEELRSQTVQARDSGKERLAGLLDQIRLDVYERTLDYLIGEGK